MDRSKNDSIKTVYYKKYIYFMFRTVFGRKLNVTIYNSKLSVYYNKVYYNKLYYKNS